MAGASYGLNRLLKDKPYHIKVIPIKIIGVFLIQIEIMKQIYSLTREQGYDTFDLPFQFCSFFLVVIPISGFYTGSHKDEVHSVTCSCCMSLLLLTCIYPNIIYGRYSIRSYFTDFRGFHTVTFHEFAIFAYFIIIALRIHVPKKICLIPPVLFAVCFSIFAAIMSNTIKENYANFYYCTVGPIDDFKDKLQDNYSYWPIQILYIFIVGVVHVVFVIMNYFIYYGTQKLFKFLIGEKEDENEPKYDLITNLV
jgi:hypothetical protein